MITEKANVLHEKITRLSLLELSKNRKLSEKLLTELVDSCKPTKEEFDRLTSSMLVSGGTLWDMIPAILEWQK